MKTKWESLILLLNFISFVTSTTPILSTAQKERLGISKRNYGYGAYSAFHSNFDVKWKWDNRLKGYKVPYIITYQKPTVQRHMNKVTEIFNSKTNIRFVPREYDDRYYLNLQKGEDCCSYVGCKKWAGQAVSLAPEWCYNSLGSILHELMHALGWMHEHQRNDRDDYVYVPQQNNDFWKTNCGKISLPEGMFRKASSGTFYDFNSIMHYPMEGCAMKAKRQTDEYGNSHHVAGQRNGLSKQDIFEVNQIYPNLEYCSDCDSKECDKFYGHTHTVWRGGDGSMYVGCIKNGYSSGYGTWHEPSGNYYEGMWKDDDYHGKGTLFVSEQGKNMDYTGLYPGKFSSNSWQYGKLNGYGEYVGSGSQAGSSYKGQWRNNELNGYGTWIDRDGTWWQGTFVDGWCRRGCRNGRV